METPDLVGLRLQDALKLLEECSPHTVPVVVRYSSPASKTFDPGPELEERVIRQRALDEGKVELVVSSFRCCLHDL